jgi:hypothetical protein
MRDKLLTMIFYPFVVMHVHYITIKSVIKHYKFFKEHHPDMDAETRRERIVENVVRDMDKFRRELGISDSQMR